MSPHTKILEENRHKIRIMRGILLVGMALTIGKFVAYWLTHSNAVLTDALESIINIIAAAFGLYSLVYASRPKDEDHPYGHGKMEFLAVGFEGGLILFAGGAMLFKAVHSLFNPVSLEKIDFGLWITVVAAFVNFLMGRYLLSAGKKFHSNTLVADGKHLLSDTWSSIALLIGLFVIRLTGWFWVDTFLTIFLGIYILVVGYRLVKDSLAGLLDEADFGKLSEIVEVLNRERKDLWIDIHNLRVVRYGSHIHIDAHLTLPWYHDLERTHTTVKDLERIVNEQFGHRVEFFIHTDPCLPASCAICSIAACSQRRQEFSHRLEWDLSLLLKNRPHS
ncbi:MAG: cation diffusion facilitator family transporter [Bacteroidota bacterium]